MFRLNWFNVQADRSVVVIAARSDWDNGRWEWEDTPRRDYRDDRPGSQRHHPTRSPMLAAASPDARLVSPWLGGNTPRSTGKETSTRSSVIFTLCSVKVSVSLQISVTRLTYPH
jgi:hypothetical protein